MRAKKVDGRQLKVKGRRRIYTEGAEFTEKRADQKGTWSYE